MLQSQRIRTQLNGSVRMIKVDSYGYAPFVTPGVTHQLTIPVCLLTTESSHCHNQFIQGINSWWHVS